VPLSVNCACLQSICSVICNSLRRYISSVPSVQLVNIWSSERCELPSMSVGAMCCACSFVMSDVISCQCIVGWHWWLCEWLLQVTSDRHSGRNSWDQSNFSSVSGLYPYIVLHCIAITVCVCGINTLLTCVELLAGQSVTVKAATSVLLALQPVNCGCVFARLQIKLFV